MGANYSMTTKYIITMAHDLCLGKAGKLLYYAGQAGGTVPLLDYRKTKAKRYLWEHEAVRDMTILKAMFDFPVTFSVVAIRCRA